MYSSLPFILYGKPHQKQMKKVKEDIKKPQVSAMQEIHLFSKKKIGVYNYAMLCFHLWFIQSIAAKSRLQVQKCLKYLYLFVMYPFSCQLLPLFEYTKYQTLTPTSRVHYSPKP